jgi:hypothetical protein
MGLAPCVLGVGVPRWHGGILGVEPTLQGHSSRGLDPIVLGPMDGFPFVVHTLGRE